MGKIKQLLTQIIQVLQKRLLAAFHIIVAIVVSLVIYHFTIGEPANEVIRNIIFATGGIGGLYGLIIATRRQDRFEEQVRQGQVILKSQQRQVFNDQLGRAVEMLANQDQTSIRMAGIRIMQELGKSSNQKRKQLVKNILVDFIHEKANLNNPESFSYEREIEFAVIAVTSIQTSGYVSFQKLRLNDIQFRHCIFNNIQFLFCQIKETHFYETTFKTCRFYECDLTKAKFSRSTFKNIVDFKVD